MKYEVFKYQGLNCRFNLDKEFYQVKDTKGVWVDVRGSRLHNLLLNAQHPILHTFYNRRR